MSLARALSWIWPVRMARAQGLHGSLELMWEQGRLVVNSAHANQSHGALHRVWQRVFREAGLPSRALHRVLLLGLGTGSVVHILRHELRHHAPITAVENDPVMLDWGRTHFGLERIPDLQVVQGDALAVLPTLDGRFDLLVVDLFEDLDLARDTESPDFIRALEEHLAPDGLLCWNTIARNGDQLARVQQVEALLRERFGTVRILTLEAVNRVLLTGPRNG